MLKKIVIGIAFVLIVIQFIRPEKNLSTGMGNNDISVVYPDMPANLKVMLQQKCYDCHSNNTHYPWYASLQPVAWFMNSHIQEGKEHLNFSEFKTYEPKRANHKLAETLEEITEGHMPIKSYLLMHAEAAVTQEEQAELRQWLTSMGVSEED